MKLSKTYWITALSILLSLSLALPNCCHAEISALFSHHQQAASHSAHETNPEASSCKCGHELVKDYQKTKKVINGNQKLVPALSYDLSVGENKSTPIVSNFFGNKDAYSGIDYGPPTYLLNSVFLN